MNKRAEPRPLQLHRSGYLSPMNRCLGIIRASTHGVLMRCANLCVLLALLTGCPSGGGSSSPEPPQPPTEDTSETTAADDTGEAQEADDTGKDDTGKDDTEEVADWLFLIYMAGDNDLEEWVTKDLNELERIGSGSGIHVVVQADRAEGGDRSDGDWTSTRRYYVEADSDEDQVGSTMVADLGELDMADPETLSDFLRWARETYPAQRVFLSMWSHGDSWKLRSNNAAAAAAAAPPPPYIITDDASGGSMSIAEGELVSGLQDHLDAWGPLDIIAFDACLMGSWEVAHALQDHAAFMTASEEGVGMNGYAYDRILSHIREDPEAELEGIVAEIARSTVEDNNEYTHSAIDLSKISTLSTAIDDLAAAAIESPAIQAELLSARDASFGMWGEGWEIWYIDLLDLTRQLADTDQEALRQGGASVEAALSETVLAAYGGVFGSWDYTQTGGLTIFFAHDRSSPQTLDLYANGAGARWSEDTRWDDLLQEMSAAPNIR